MGCRDGNKDWFGSLTERFRSQSCVQKSNPMSPKLESRWCRITDAHSTEIPTTFRDGRSVQGPVQLPSYRKRSSKCHRISYVWPISPSWRGVTWRRRIDSRHRGQKNLLKTSYASPWSWDDNWPIESPQSRKQQKRLTKRREVRPWTTLS